MNIYIDVIYVLHSYLCLYTGKAWAEGVDYSNGSAQVQLSNNTIRAYRSKDGYNYSSEVSRMSATLILVPR